MSPVSATCQYIKASCFLPLSFPKSVHTNRHLVFLAVPFLADLRLSLPGVSDTLSHRVKMMLCSPTHKPLNCRQALIDSKRLTSLGPLCMVTLANKNDVLGVSPARASYARLKCQSVVVGNHQGVHIPDDRPCIL